GFLLPKYATGYYGALTTTFTRTISQGSTGADVKALQVFLNTHGYIIATSGNGSPGHESTYFGIATKNALIKFQNANKATILTPYGLTKGTGILGAKTREVVEMMLK
ncbi:MAG: peptidoglycan-binding domain-containing protein, partial [bacterium]